MTSLKVRRFWQTGRYAVGILVCFHVLGLVPVGYGQTDPVSKLISQLKDPDSTKRYLAAKGLAETKNARAVKPLIAALNDTDAFVRYCAAGALGDIKDPRAVEPLIAALKDTDAFVRYGAAIALGSIKDPRAVEPLNAALTDPAPNVRQSAASALGQIKGLAPSANQSSGLTQEEYKATDLLLEAEFVLKKGSTFTQSEVKQSCSSGISLNKGLHLGGREIPLKSTELTSDCMIETRDYGDLFVKFNSATFTSSILVTPTQEKLFKNLAQSHGEPNSAFGQEMKASEQKTQSLNGARKAVEQGDAKAQFNLGTMYAKGQGVPQDYAEAVRWYRKAAEQGDTEAQLSLGSTYENGQGVPQDYAEAVRWYRKAADQGDAKAQFNLGNMYGQGQGVPQDYAEALRWWRKAADLGIPIAQYNIGVAYYQGRGMPQDYDKALHWFRKAADQGDAKAQFNLGVMYYNAEAAPQDYVQAYMWMSLAASDSNGGDQQKHASVRDSVARRMTAQQLAEAQRRTREWKPTTNDSLY